YGPFRYRTGRISPQPIKRREPISIIEAQPIAPRRPFQRHSKPPPIYCQITPDLQKTMADAAFSLHSFRAPPPPLSGDRYAGRASQNTEPPARHTGFMAGGTHPCRLFPATRSAPL